MQEMRKTKGQESVDRKNTGGETLIDRLRAVTEKYPDHAAQYSKDQGGNFRKTTYRELYREVSAAGAGFLSIGVRRGDLVGLVSDNRKEWLLADLGLAGIGAADVPRGCDTMAQELGFILGFAECRTVIVENGKQLRKLVEVADQMPELRTVVLFDPPDEADSAGAPADWMLVPFSGIMEQGEKALTEDPDRFEREAAAGTPRDIATVIFTSGTTGRPKGVMLSHDNFLHQVRGVPELIHVGPGDTWLCVLPVWHSFERVMQYVAMGTGSALAYSKPIGKVMLADFQAIKPTWMASVPRIWESLMSGIYQNVRSQGGAKALLFHAFVAIGSAHARLTYRLRGLLPRFRRRSRILEVAVSLPPWLALLPLRALGNTLVFGKIKQKLGGRFVAGISGGGALPARVDTFFAAAGILLLEGYGLTETAPVLGVRAQDHPVPGTVGPVFPGTEVRIVDEQGHTLSPGRKGLILARGPQVMLGYYKQEELTRSILSEDGWLDTGDLGMLTLNNELKILGRAKDTIVLLGGENVEPAPIEEKLRESEYIDQAVLLGQDQKFLAALIVPNMERLEGFARENGIPFLDSEQLITLPEIRELIREQIDERVSARTGFKSFERVYRFTLVSGPFEVGKELSHKQEVKRHAIDAIYREKIRELFR